MDLVAEEASAPEKCTRRLVLIAVMNAKYLLTLLRVGLYIARSASLNTGSPGTRANYTA
jgi:hypothetical protein